MLDNFDERGFHAALFGPMECLRGRVGLIVMLAFWEAREFVEVLGEIPCFGRQVNKAILHHTRHRVHARDFVH